MQKERLINNSSQINMFRAIILPIFRSTRLCYSLWYNAPTMLPATVPQHLGCIIPQAVTHSLVFLKMGK